MNKQKDKSTVKVNTPSTNLQKSSVIFMQLGLILALFVVYIIMEHESYYKIKPIALANNIDEEDEKIIGEFIYEPKKIERKKTVKIEKVKKIIPVQKLSTDFKMVKDTDKKIEDAVLKTTETTSDEAVKTTPNIEEVDPWETTTETLPFIAVEVAPLFPGCKKGSKAAMKACFNEKMRKHINRKFDTGLAQTLGLTPGKKRINVEFIIDEKGNVVDIKVRAPHKRLQKEAKRVVKLLPQMVPAKQRASNVKVRYNLPISFIVDDN